MRKCTFIDPRYRGGYETDDKALAEIKAELQAEMVSFEGQAAPAAVAIRIDEEEAQPEPPRKRMPLGTLLQKRPTAAAGPVGTAEELN